MNRKSNFLIVGTRLMAAAVLALGILVASGSFFVATPPTPALACGGGAAGGACCSGGSTAAGSSSTNSKLISFAQSVKTNIDKALTALQKGDTNGAVMQLKTTEQQLSVISGGNRTTTTTIPSAPLINIGASSCGCGGGGITSVNAC